MGIGSGWRALVFVVILAWPAPSAAQDLAPVLADRFSQGVSSLKAGDLEAAERAFRDVLAGGGNRAFVHHNLGIVLQQRGRDADAIAEFRSATRLDPTFGPSSLLEGTSLLALGRTIEARAALERAVRLIPREPSAHLQLAAACERSNDLAGVVDEYRTLRELDPNNSEWMYRLGRAYLKLAQWSFERMRSVNPRTARLPQALAEQYMEQHRPDLALRAYEDAARLDPGLPGIHLALAQIHLDGGRLNEADREIDRELALQPRSAAARALKARIAAARSNP
jgi:Tfp pilus assembly protein PilF